MKQKRSDFETIPLCNPHHDEQHRMGWKAFIAKYDLDILELLTALNVKPRIYNAACEPFHSDRYWMKYQGNLYALSPLADGPKKAHALAQEHRREWLVENVFRPVEKAS